MPQAGSIRANRALTVRTSQAPPCDDPTPDGPLPGGLGCRQGPGRGAVCSAAAIAGMLPVGGVAGDGPLPGRDAMTGKRVPDGVRPQGSSTMPAGGNEAPGKWPRHSLSGVTMSPVARNKAGTPTRWRNRRLLRHRHTPPPTRETMTCDGDWQTPDPTKTCPAHQDPGC